MTAKESTAMRSTVPVQRLAGSGVWHSDQHVLAKHTPRLRKMLADRRIVDGGIVRCFSQEATGKDLTPVNDRKDHRALGDIRLHQEEGRTYRRLFQGAA
ncbi:hypothetical protein [Agromyces sp. PvR057]|uniref:hypothetical protein n=1 Tax=Agromyces sp. PvR057 TaxID=3156403 RepID=UPI000E22A82D